MNNDKESIIIFSKKEWDIYCNQQNIPLENKEKIFVNMVFYIISISGLNNFISKIFLPFEFIKDQKLFNLISNFLNEKNIEMGVILDLQKIYVDKINYSNFTNESIKKIIDKKIYNIYCSYEFGERNCNSSPKNNIYGINTQYQWTNIVLLKKSCDQNNINLFLNIDLLIPESSVENSYIHYRQVLWDGFDLLKKFNINIDKIILNPIYSNIKNIREDYQTVASITYRCITECINKYKLKIFLLPNEKMDFIFFKRYLSQIYKYDKQNNINIAFDFNILKKFYKEWNNFDDNILYAQQNLYTDIEKCQLEN